MRIVLAVLLVSIAFVASYPSSRDDATDNEDNDLELELRSILNHLSEEKMERSVASDEDSDDDDDADEYAVSKRQGGHNVIDKQSDCEIKCIYQERNPKVGKGKTVGQAAKVCKQKCPNPNKKRTQKKEAAKKKSTSGNNFGLRDFTEDDDNMSEEQQIERRELYNYLMEKLQQNNDE